MRSQRGWIAAALALVVLVGAGVLLVLHLPASAAPAAPPTAPPGAAGPAPSEAKKAIGRPPRVDSPKAGAAPSVLGTVVVVRGPGTQLEVQPTAVSTGDQASGSDRRLIRVQVGFLAVTGSARASDLDLTLVDEAGTRYASRAALAFGDVPPLGSSTVPAGGRAAGAVFFEVPTSASSLVLAYAPEPSKVVRGRWLLSAP